MSFLALVRGLSPSVVRLIHVGRVHNILCDVHIVHKARSIYGRCNPAKVSSVSSTFLHKHTFLSFHHWSHHDTERNSLRSTRTRAAARVELDCNCYCGWSLGARA